METQRHHEHSGPEMPSSAAARAIWERIAGWWDSAIGEGNEFQRELIMPTTDRLLAIRPGESVADICCGNGNYARRLAGAGAHVIACDGSETFIARARQYPQPQRGSVEYLVRDATDQSQLLNLGEGRFDAAVCSMAIMDLPTIDPLLLAARRLVKPAGRFVFSVPHPCFNLPESRLTAELVYRDGQPSQAFGVQVNAYLQPTVERSSGILHQPEPHYYFHRPLSVLVGQCVAAGWLLDHLAEPAFQPGGNGKNAFSWARRPQIPPVLVVRLRPG